MKIKQLLTEVSKLSANDVLVLKDALKRRENQVESSIVLQSKTHEIVSCPHCNSTSIVGFGSKDGRKRFKCKSCSKTFNSLTNSPLARLRKLDKHIANANCMLGGISIRKTAELINVAPSTAFRWRHRFLSKIETMNPTELAGIVEADETYFKESFKGKKGGEQALGRKPKTRGTPATHRGLSKEQIPVLVVRDRTNGKTLTAVIPSTSANDLAKVIKPVLTEDAELISDSAGTYRKMAKQYNISLRMVPRNKTHKTSGTLHINNVNAYDSRLKSWMFPFKGVATKYLSNYLGWHRLLDGKKINARKFLALAIG